MFFLNIHYVVVAVAALISVALGFVWYSPWMFGKLFMREIGVTPEKAEEFKRNGGQKKMAGIYGLTLVFSLLTAFVISVLFNSLIITSFSGFLVLAFCLWGAFSLPVSANNVMYGNDSVILFAITTGYQLVSIGLMTFTIGIWG
jgi:hypothetical protein